MTQRERTDAFFFLVGACETEDEVDELWRQCFQAPTQPNVLDDREETT